MSESRAAATRAPFTTITLDGTSNVSSPLTDSKSRRKGSSSSQTVTAARRTESQCPPTRLTPQHVLKANMEINEMKEVHLRVYGWALDALVSIVLKTLQGRQHHNWYHCPCQHTSSTEAEGSIWIYWSRQVATNFI